MGYTLLTQAIRSHTQNSKHSDITIWQNIFDFTDVFPARESIQTMHLDKHSLPIQVSVPFLFSCFTAGTHVWDTTHDIPPFDLQLYVAHIYETQRMTFPLLTYSCMWHTFTRHNTWHSSLTHSCMWHIFMRHNTWHSSLTYSCMWHTFMRHMIFLFDLQLY